MDRRLDVVAVSRETPCGCKVECACTGFDLGVEPQGEVIPVPRERNQRVRRTPDRLRDAVIECQPSFADIEPLKKPEPSIRFRRTQFGDDLANQLVGLDIRPVVARRLEAELNTPVRRAHDGGRRADELNLGGRHKSAAQRLRAEADLHLRDGKHGAARLVAQGDAHKTEIDASLIARPAQDRVLDMGMVLAQRLVHRAFDERRQNADRERAL